MAVAVVEESSNSGLGFLCVNYGICWVWDSSHCPQGEAGGPEGLEVSALGLGCKSPFNFLEFIEKDVDLEEELKEFECEFECNEVVKV